MPLLSIISQIPTFLFIKNVASSQLLLFYHSLSTNSQISTLPTCELRARNSVLRPVHFEYYYMLIIDSFWPWCKDVFNSSIFFTCELRARNLIVFFHADFFYCGYVERRICGCCELAIWNMFCFKSELRARNSLYWCYGFGVIRLGIVSSLVENGWLEELKDQFLSLSNVLRARNFINSMDYNYVVNIGFANIRKASSISCELATRLLVFVQICFLLNLFMLSC